MGGMGGNLMARLEEADPALAKELKALKEQVPPHAAQRVVREISKQMRQFMKESGGRRGLGGQNREEMRKRLQGLAILELKTLMAGLKIQFTEVEKGPVKAQLKTDLSSLFDEKLAMQGEKVKQMEAKLTELQKLIAERKSHKADIVEDRFDELVGSRKRYSW
jgi:hypothetical protein